VVPMLTEIHVKKYMLDPDKKWICNSAYHKEVSDGSKFHFLADAIIASKNKKCVVMMEDEQIEALHKKMNKKLAGQERDVWTLQSKDKGTVKETNTISVDTGTFNVQHPTKGGVLLLSTDQYSKGVNLVDAELLYLANPDINYVQQMGRILRGCQNKHADKVQIYMLIARHPWVQTYDDKLLCDMVTKRDENIEKMKHLQLYSIGQLVLNQAAKVSSDAAPYQRVEMHPKKMFKFSTFLYNPKAVKAQQNTQVEQESPDWMFLDPKKSYFAENGTKWPNVFLHSRMEQGDLSDSLLFAGLDVREREWGLYGAALERVVKMLPERNGGYSTDMIINT